MEKEINTVINSLFDGFNKESQENYGQLMKTFLENMNEPQRKSMASPENFNLFTTFPFEQAIEVLVKIIYPNISEKQFNDIRFLFLHYSFFEHQVTSVIKTTEGSICSHDKVAWIIRVFLKYILTGKLIQKTNSDEQYWEPKNGSMEDWMEFCSNIKFLYYGQLDKFLNSYKKLIVKE